MEAASTRRDRMVRHAQAVWRTTPHDRCGRATTALVRNGQRERLGKAASGKTGARRFLELHVGTLGRPAKPPDCAHPWGNVVVAVVPRSGPAVLGAHALHHGTEDAAHHPESFAAQLTHLQSASALLFAFVVAGLSRGVRPGSSPGRPVLGFLLSVPA